LDDNVVAVVGIVFLFGVPMLVWMLSRVLKHRERMEMIRAGMPLPGKMGSGASFRATVNQTDPLRRSSSGPELDYSPAAAQVALRKAIVLTCVGFALLIGLSFIGFGDGWNWRPGPWLLGGLIPMFIGIAQIIIALMSGAVFLPYGQLQPPQPPPSSFGPPPAAGAVPPTYDTSYTYRPGATQELRPPSPPPERRP